MKELDLPLGNYYGGVSVFEDQGCYFMAVSCNVLGGTCVEISRALYWELVFEFKDRSFDEAERVDGQRTCIDRYTVLVEVEKPEPVPEPKRDEPAVVYNTVDREYTVSRSQYHCYAHFFIGAPALKDLPPGLGKLHLPNGDIVNLVDDGGAK